MALIAICAAALIGLASGDVARLDPWRLGAASVVAAAGAALGWRKPAWRTIALAACAVALGALRATTAPAPAAAVARLAAAAPAAAVAAAPAAESAVERAAEVAPRAAPAAAPVAASIEAAPVAASIEAAPVAASIEAVPLAVSIEAAPGAVSNLLEASQTIRQAAEANIHRSLPEPQASLAAGVLLGGSGQLDAAFKLDLQRSGLAHLVAIDGFKQVLVAAALGAISVRFLGARLAVLPIIAGIGAYTLLTGAHPSAVRAGLMVALAALASLNGRIADPLTSLMLALVTMGALQPRVLLDVGLLLSMSATLGIILLWPRFRRRLRRLPRPVGEPLGLTCAVTLATLPVMLARFQLVSLISPAAHVLALPLLPPLLVGTAALAVLGPVPVLGTLVGWLAWLPSTLLVHIVHVTGGLPGAALSTGRLSAVAAVCLAAALLACGCWGLPEMAAARQRLTRGAHGLGVSALALAALTIVSLARPDGRVHVARLHAGRGEAVFIRGPTGRTALVTSGHLDSRAVSEQVADHLLVWEHKLDTAVALDAASAAGLSHVIARYPADRVLAAATGRVVLSYRELEPRSAPTTSVARPGSAD